MTQQTCPVCEQTHYSNIRIFDDYRIEFCDECGHGITLPALTPVELDQLYNEHYFTDQYQSCSPDKNEIQKKAKQEDHRVKVLRQHLARGKLLDVGCGLGFFLYACKNQYSSYGFDVSISNKTYIERQLGLQLFTEEKELQIFSDEQGRFDAITFWHSLEHFTNPSATLNQFKALLKDDGVLIIDVPVNDSIDAGMKENNWEGWQIPFHQHHFTSNSLNHFIKNNGFEIIASHSYRSGHVYDSLKKKWYLKPFARGIAKLFQGGSMVIVCKKTV